MFILTHSSRCTANFVCWLYYMTATHLLVTRSRPAPHKLYWCSLPDSGKFAHTRQAQHRQLCRWKGSWQPSLETLAWRSGETSEQLQGHRLPWPWSGFCWREPFGRSPEARIPFKLFYINGVHVACNWHFNFCDRGKEGAEDLATTCFYWSPPYPKNIIILQHAGMDFPYTTMPESPQSNMFQWSDQNVMIFITKISAVKDVHLKMNKTYVAKLNNQT